MQPHAILAYCAGYDVATLAPFVSSWKRKVPSARLLVFYTNMTNADMDILKGFGVEFVDIERYWPSPYRGITLRFFMWRDYMREFGGQFIKVMVSDVRDVIFQADPFVIDIESPVIWASEDKVIRSDPNWNLRWLLELFGSNIVEELADQYASCCGTTLGTRAGMSQYLEDMCQLIDATAFDQAGVYEQGFHNYVVHRLKPKYGTLELVFHLFATIGTVSQSRIKICDGNVLVDGCVIPVVHQWDRHANITKMISEDIRFRLT